MNETEPLDAEAIAAVRNLVATFGDLLPGARYWVGRLVATISGSDRDRDEARAQMICAEADAYRQRVLVDELRGTIATKEAQWLEMNAEIERLRAELRSAAQELGRPDAFPDLVDACAREVRSARDVAKNRIAQLEGERDEARRLADVAIRTARVNAEVLAPHIEKIKGIDLHNRFAAHAATLEDEIKRLRTEFDSTRHQVCDDLRVARSTSWFGLRGICADLVKIAQATAQASPLVDEDGRGTGRCPLCEAYVEAPGDKGHAEDCALILARKIPSTAP